jgi:hypothetical protein
MTDFATDLLWEEEKQPVLPVPARPHDRQQEKKEQTPAPATTAESLAERLQRVAGNAALAREAEEAEAVGKRLAEAARRPEKAPATAPAPKPETANPDKRRREEVRAEAVADPKGPPAARKKAAEKQAAKTAVTTEAQRLSKATKAAAARAAALAQVLAAFEKDAGRADLLTLALLIEDAPPGIAEETARALAHAVMRADPAQRAAIAARVGAQLGDRRDLRLARFLADRLVGLATAPARPAPPPPPPG